MMKDFGKPVFTASCATKPYYIAMYYQQQVVIMVHDHITAIIS